MLNVGRAGVCDGRADVRTHIYSRPSRLSKTIAVLAHLCDEMETQLTSAIHTKNMTIWLHLPNDPIVEFDSQQNLSQVVEHQHSGQAHNHHYCAPIETAITKKRKIIIHDTDSDDDHNQTMPTNVVSDCPNAMQTTASDDRTLLHAKDCTCTRCADKCKYLDKSAKHVGTDSSGTTGSSESDDSNSFNCTEDDSFVCDDDAVYTAAEKLVLNKMFPKTSHLFKRHCVKTRVSLLTE
jgi:hypothetical protein